MEQYEDQWFINEKYFTDDLWIFLVVISSNFILEFM